jgi:hypothetical protein
MIGKLSIKGFQLLKNGWRTMLTKKRNWFFISDRVPEKVRDLTQEQVAYLRRLTHSLTDVKVWEADELQTTLFATAKELECSNPLHLKLFTYHS